MMAKATKKQTPKPPVGRVVMKKESHAFLHAYDVTHGPYWAIQKALKDLHGYDAMQKMTKILPRLEKKWPGRIMQACVDDDYNAGARLYFITHEDPKKNQWMGVTALYIPQCTAEAPIRFFMYDGHRSEVIKALKWVGSRRAKYPRGES